MVIKIETLYLMKKNEPVIEIFMEGKAIRAFKMLNRNHIPHGLINPAHSLNNFNNIYMSIDMWIKSRCIPNSRQEFSHAKSKLKLIDLTKIVMHNYGLSLNDDYWFKLETDTVTWEEINFFSNTYSKELGDYITNPRIINDICNFVSPDLTTNGDDFKRWKQDDNNVSYLYKTNVDNAQVACNELFASNLCDILGFNHIKYEIKEEPVIIYKGKKQQFQEMVDVYEEKNCVFAYSQNYCTENKSFLSAQNFLHMLQPATSTTLIAAFKKNPRFKKELDKMIFLDYIIENTDRSGNNYGFIVNENNEIIDLFPIFDCGNSMCYLDRYREDTRDYSKMFNKPFNQLLELIDDIDVDFEALLKIDDMYYKTYELSEMNESELYQVLKAYKERVNQAKEILYNKKNF